MSNFINWRMAIIRSQLSSYAKYLGLYLNTFMNDRHDMAWPSLSTIESETGLARSTVVKYLDEMEKSGWITRTRRFQKSVVYKAKVPNSSRDELLGEKHGSKSSPDELTVVRHTDPNSPLNSPLKEKINQKRKIPAQHELAHPEPAVPVGLNEQAWSDYVAYRRQMKLRKLQPATERRQTQWLADQGDEQHQQAIIEQTIRNGYQGLFALKGDRNAKSSGNGKTSAAERAAWQAEMDAEIIEGALQ